jgi:hypothetical protein
MPSSSSCHIGTGEAGQVGEAPEYEICLDGIRRCHESVSFPSLRQGKIFALPFPLSYTPPNRLSSQPVLRQVQDRLFDILDILRSAPPASNQPARIYHPSGKVTLGATQSPNKARNSAPLRQRSQKIKQCFGVNRPRAKEIVKHAQSHKDTKAGRKHTIPLRLRVFARVQQPTRLPPFRDQI